MKEAWRLIPGFMGYYEISNFGRVRSWNNNGHGRAKKPHFMNGACDTKGYRQVTLPYGDGRIKMYKVGRLVAENFIVNEIENLQVNHIDGNKINDSVENLEWVTGSENMLHAYRTGLR